MFAHVLRRAAAIVLCASSVVGAEDAPVAAEALVLDGLLVEAAWAGAREIEVASLEVPSLSAPSGKRTLQPRVRVLHRAGALWFGVEADEPPGQGIGLDVFIAPVGARSAAEAASCSARPLELRTPAVFVQASIGSGADILGVRVAAHVADADAWSLEVVVPIAPLGVLVADESATAGSVPSLAIAGSVATRMPSLLAPFPPESFGTPPSAWAVFDAPAAGWGVPERIPTAEEGEAAEARELAREEAWLAFLARLFEQVSIADDAREAGRISARQWMLGPLDGLLEVRPDLAVPVASLRGDLLERMGFLDDAKRSYDEALAKAPGWLEARFGRDVRVFARRTTDGTPGGSSDYAAWHATIAAREAEVAADDAWSRAGIALARAILDYREGRFGEASLALAPLAELFSFDVWLLALRDRVEAARRSEYLEQKRRAQVPVAPLPRLVLETTRGPVQIELFEDDALAAVHQVVWLAGHGFYDGTRIHQTVPGAWTLGGDPGSRDDVAGPEIGLGGPGYVVQAPGSVRAPWRGAFLLERPAEGVVGSRFALATGSMFEGADAFVVVGRVVEGQEAADALRRGDTIESAQVVGRRAGASYRPTAIDGRPAPVPVKPER